MKKISVIFGTRPEAIKMAPIILRLKNNPNFLCQVCVTGQHRQMLDQVLTLFNITPDADFDLMQPNQTLSKLTAKAIVSIDDYLVKEKPDIVLIQGDTTTVLSTAITAFYHNIPIGHVEAGLRTGNIHSPWPEEANRCLTSKLATWHFAPTGLNRQNLLNEGVSEEKIFVTGNTVIDSLFLVLEKIKDNPVSISGLPGNSLEFMGDQKMILITGHRRENFGLGFENICLAIAKLADTFSNVHFIYPVHLNPNVRKPVQRILGKYTSTNNTKGNVHLIEPQDYLHFISLMNRSYLILTDSGGIQEEAPSLGKPVLVMRDTTERPEALAAGTVQLVGTNKIKVIESTAKLLNDKSYYSKVSHIHNPYGNGTASNQIINILSNV